MDTICLCKSKYVTSTVEEFLSSIGCEECCSESLLMKLVNESIIDCFIKETFPQFETS